MIIEKPNLKSLLTGMGLIAALGMVPTAVAANDARSTDGPIVLAQAASFDEDTLEAFVVAQNRVVQVRTEYTAAFEAAQSDEQRAQISQEASEAMTQAVQAAPDITVEEYNAVIEAANQDPELLERINEVMAETNG